MRSDAPGRLGRVTVVIPTYNRAGLVQRAVDSALKQTARDRCDIVVVDDGSTDETPTVLGRYNGTVRYVRQDNAGVAAARNTAIRTWPNEFVAFLDSDDTWTADAIERRLAALHRYPQAVFAAGQGVLRDAGGREWGGDIPAVPFDVPVDLAPAFFERVFVVTSSVVVRARYLRRTGLFPLMKRGEDYLLWLRLACQGPAVLLRERVATCDWGAPASLSRHALDVALAEVRLRYLMQPELRRRPDCRAAWRQGLVRRLAALRDQAWRQGDDALAARAGFRSLMLQPTGRARWEWGRVVHALLRCAAR